MLLSRSGAAGYAWAAGLRLLTAVLNGYLLRGMREGQVEQDRLRADGPSLADLRHAGRGIPGVCHAVILENIGEES